MLVKCLKSYKTRKQKYKLIAIRLNKRQYNKSSIDLLKMENFPNTWDEKGCFNKFYYMIFFTLFLY